MKKLLLILIVLSVAVAIAGRISVKQVQAQVEIDAPAERVWAVLTRFEKYTDWNPFIRRVSGEASEGARLKVTIDSTLGSEVDFPVRVGGLRSQHEMVWIGRPLLTDLLDGRHYFRIERISAARVRLVQLENYSGLLLYPLWLFIAPAAQQGFEAMNQALKAEAERQDS